MPGKADNERSTLEPTQGNKVLSTAGSTGGVFATEGGSEPRIGSGVPSIEVDAPEDATDRLSTRAKSIPHRTSMVAMPELLGMARRDRVDGIGDVVVIEVGCKRAR